MLVLGLKRTVARRAPRFGQPYSSHAQLRGRFIRNRNRIYIRSRKVYREQRRRNWRSDGKFGCRSGEAVQTSRRTGGRSFHTDENIMIVGFRCPFSRPLHSTFFATPKDPPQAVRRNNQELDGKACLPGADRRWLFRTKAAPRIHIESRIVRPLAGA